jgi:galactose mutarotase-like enzyme
MSVTLRDSGLEATFLPELGMVCSSLVCEGEELLAQRGGPEAYAQHGSTFGIPLLYPWANRLSGWDFQGVELHRDSPGLHVDDATGLPIHGLLAASPYWEVTLSEPAALVAGLDYGAHPELLAAFPFPHRLKLSGSVAAARLSIALTVTPTEDTAVPVSFGFHPYLRCDREQARIELPVRRRVLLDERGLPTGAHEILGSGELDGPLGERTFDDSYDVLATEPVFSVADARRSISIEFVAGVEAAGRGAAAGGAGAAAGFDVAQVYAPVASDFICFEPMTAPVDALRTGERLRWVAPGSEFTAELAIAVTS